jgi:hypothetical protein
VLDSDEQTDELLRAITGLVAAKYRWAGPSVYLHGSRLNRSRQASSDIDVTVILKDPTWQVHLGNDFRNLDMDLPVRLDAGVYSLASLNSPEHGYEAGRVLNAAKLVYGDDVRPLLTAEFVQVGHRSRTLEQARKGIALLRGVEQVPTPLDFPDERCFFFGYELVRKPSWYAHGDSFGTKELVATATWCASAWLAANAGVAVYSKRDAVDRYAATRYDANGELVADLWELCRVNLANALPEGPDDRSQLRLLCARFLALEREIASLDSGIASSA